MLEKPGRCILTFKVLLLGAADFVCGGFAHSFADRRAGHAVLRCCDTIRDRLSRHRFGSFLRLFRQTDLFVSAGSSGGSWRSGNYTFLILFDYSIPGAKNTHTHTKKKYMCSVFSSFVLISAAVEKKLTIKRYKIKMLVCSLPINLSKWQDLLSSTYLPT